MDKIKKALMIFLVITTVYAERTLKTFKHSTSIALSSDNRYIVTGKSDNTAKLLDRESGAELKTFGGLFTKHNKVINSIAISKDNRYIVTGSSDNTAKLWDRESGEELKTLAGHSHYVISVTLSSDNSYVVTGSTDNTAKLWDIKSGKALQTFKGHSNSVTCVTISSDNRYIVTGSSDKTAKLWDAENSKVIMTFTGHSSIVKSVALSNDNRFVLTGSDDKTARLWDSKSGKVLKVFNGHSGYVSSIAFSNDNRFILTGSNDDTVKLWNRESGIELKTFVSGTSGDITSVALSKNKLYITKRDLNIVMLWETNPISASELDGLALKSKAIKNNKKVFNHEYSQKPFTTIAKSIQSQIDAYLTPRSPMTLIIPPEIAKPALPPVATLVKDEFESKAEFASRVERVMAERAKSIETLQSHYRHDVEARNQEVERLKKLYAEDLTKIAKEQEAKKQAIPEKLREFSAIALQNVMGALTLKKANYDAETKVMYVDISATNANWSKKVALPISDKAVAKSLKENLATADAIAEFELVDNNFVLKSIKINETIATLTDTDFRPETVKVAIEDKKIAFDSKSQAKLTLQNPNLVDRYQVQALGYGESANAKGQKFTDDLEPLIAKLKPSKEDKTKWLFVIGIEQYNETEPIPYSKRSAELFTQLMQKRLGITKRNTVALIDSKATAGAIQDKLDYLLTQDIKVGDSIYFYYNGHGMPDATNEGEPFMLPSDKIPDYITREKEFSLHNIYNRLSASKAGKVITIVDSCFSGASDGKTIIKGVAAPRIKPKKVSFDKSKMVVLTAGQGTQYSNMYAEKGHRLFSYFVMKSIASGKNSITDIFKESSFKTSEASDALGPLKKQEPTIDGNAKLEL